MATEQQVKDARKAIDDKIDIEAELTLLTNIIALNEPIEFFIKRGNNIFNFSRLKGVLDVKNASYDSMIASVESKMLAAIGPTEASVGTIRKALRDLVTAHQAAITAT